MNMASAVDLGVERLLDLDLLPAVADVVEADRRAVRGHHHDLARLLALGLQDRDQRHGEVRGVGEDQVDVGIDQELVLDDVAGVRRPPTASPPW